MPEGTGAVMAVDPAKAKRVLSALAQNKAMPLLALTTLADVPESELRRIVDNLESNNLVKIEQKGTVDEIVIIREQGIRAAS